MRNLIRFVLPPFLLIAWSIIKGLGAWLRFSQLPKVKYLSRCGEDLFILGNGPSLKESLDKYSNVIKNSNCIVVNQFAVTPYFLQIKPSAYLLADGAYFQPLDRLPERLQKLVVELIDSILFNVNWDMTIYLPFCAKDSFFYKEVIKNTHICFRFFNHCGHNMISIDNRVVFWLWNHNIIAPLSQTVLNTCLIVGVEMGYSNIFLIGADTSWHETYCMDQETNELYSIDKHFYGENKVSLYPKKIHQEFRNVSNALESYWVIESYARHNRVKIYNASEYSWIDAFERKRLNCKD